MAKIDKITNAVKNLEKQTIQELRTFSNNRDADL
jgi:hypothetical protein